MKQIQFEADKVSIRGPKVDNSYVVSFEVGEYQLKNIRELVGVLDTALKVRVEYAEPHSQRDNSSIQAGK
mgnify:CR=1 FL=1